MAFSIAILLDRSGSIASSLYFIKENNHVHRRSPTSSFFN
ncbi:hypothetical protein VL20_436 [Microcystis panniformis FACHB-1757]|uniref:Uncharacterized protein n=1 Tax=Microcystis panniformis FACHB-1757 TaxID=1638788 RepID=A0A0K1RV77_9CHRO|nr:hypothetical protein VL20_436 [Microcystis panniformis FACHB-1757]